MLTCESPPPGGSGGNEARPGHHQNRITCELKRIKGALVETAALTEPLCTSCNHSARVPPWVIDPSDSPLPFSPSLFIVNRNAESRDCLSRGCQNIWPAYAYLVIVLLTLIDDLYAPRRATSPVTQLGADVLLFPTAAVLQWIPKIPNSFAAPASFNPILLSDRPVAHEDLQNEVKENKPHLRIVIGRLKTYVRHKVSGEDRLPWGAPRGSERGRGPLIPQRRRRRQDGNRHRPVCRAPSWAGIVRISKHIKVYNTPFELAIYNNNFPSSLNHPPSSLISHISFIVSSWRYSNS
ncbi:hypothetical protein J6590_034063 [Homalodisca vitripennis]|nr:hypothetical protein J6590_034063 [Homalodisca vitripennis]